MLISQINSIEIAAVSPPKISDLIDFLDELLEIDLDESNAAAFKAAHLFPLALRTENVTGLAAERVGACNNGLLTENDPFFAVLRGMVG